MFDSDHRPELRDVGTDVQIAVCRSIASVLSRIDSFGGREGADRMIREMKEDQATGAFVGRQVHVIVGFKTHI